MYFFACQQTDPRLAYMLTSLLTPLRISTSCCSSAINSTKTPENSQTSSYLHHLETVASERRRPSFAVPLSTPFRFRHVQPVTIRLLDLVLFGPVRPSSLSLCHGAAILCPSSCNPHWASKPGPSLESLGPPMSGAGRRPDLSSAQLSTQYHHPAEILLHSGGPKGHVHAAEQIVVHPPGQVISVHCDEGYTCPKQ